MKQLIVSTLLVFASTAYAAEPAPAAQGNGMADMMKSCQQHMKDGKMMESMPKNMMENCQAMMTEGMAMNGKEQSETAKEAPAPEAGKKEDKEDHSQHHPAE